MELHFTEEQQRIFEFVRQETGHGIIDAVAGAGKTTTIIECAKFVQNQSEVLFCAFNTSISGEIGSKFRKMGLNEVTVKTIHSLGWHILNVNSPLKPELDNDKYIKLLKHNDTQEKLKPFYTRILEINGIDPLAIIDARLQFAINNLMYHINNRLIEINQKFRATLTKEELTAFEELAIHFGIFNEVDVQKRDFKEEVQNYFEAHKILLEAGNDFSKRTMIVDFTDMLYLPSKWGLHPAKKYEFIFIDECQDLSKSQFEIALKYRKHICRILAVGDPRQSIYGFTGADIQSFQRVKDNTQATQFPLATCFRCPQKAIELA